MWGSTIEGGSEHRCPGENSGRPENVGQLPTGTTTILAMKNRVSWVNLKRSLRLTTQKTQGGTRE